MEDALFCGLKRKKEDTFVVAMGEWKGLPRDHEATGWTFIEEVQCHI